MVEGTAIVATTIETIVKMVRTMNKPITEDVVTPEVDMTIEGKVMSAVEGAEHYKWFVISAISQSI